MLVSTHKVRRTWTRSPSQEVPARGPGTTCVFRCLTVSGTELLANQYLIHQRRTAWREGHHFLPEIKVSFSGVDACHLWGLPPSPPQPETELKEAKAPFTQGPSQGPEPHARGDLEKRQEVTLVGGGAGISGTSPAPDPMAQKLQPHTTSLLTQKANQEPGARPF